MMNQEIVGFLKAALECSVLVSPLDPGLTATELLEIGRRAGYQNGEISDALRSVTTAYFGTPKMRPSEQDTASWVFLQSEEPEYRNFAAFDFVVEELNALTRAEGGAKAAIAREVIVERAISKGIIRNDIEVAITWQVMSKQLSEKDGIIRFSHPGVRPPPSSQLSAFRAGKIRKPNRERAYPLVQDVIERRNDGRPSPIEPLDAFAEELDKLGYAPFRLWWKQTVTEMRLADPSASPVAISVLAAALIEGALTFIVTHARKFGGFQSSDYAKDPRTWKIDGLVASAASGGSSAILNPALRARADAVIQSRQRIHAGRMLSETAEGPTLVAAGGTDLSPAQIAMARQLGLTPITGVGEHAELTALSGARGLGLTPRAGVTTNYVCAECAVKIHKMGGWLREGRNFVFGRTP